MLLAAGNAQPLPSRASEPLSQVPAFKYYVWGQVHEPGAYNLSASPDIVELLSAGGGPTEQADLTRVVLVRAIDRRRTRVNVPRLIDRGDVIRLSPGDVVVVPRSFWYSLRDGLTVVTAVAILANLALTITYVNRAGK